MKIKLGNILNAKEGLNIIASAKFRASKLFEVTKFVQNAEKEIDDFEKVKQEKIREYGEKTKNKKGESIVEIPEFIKIGKKEVPNEKYKAFVDELNELVNKEIEINLPEISKDEFKLVAIEAGDVEMSPKELMSFLWIFEDENNGN